MPLVAVNKARRKEHQDRASAPVQVQAWNIEARHEDRIRRAVVGELREMYSDAAIEALTSFLSVIRSPMEVDSKVDELLDTEKLQARLEPIYSEIFEEMATAELKRYDIVIKTAAKRQSHRVAKLDIRDLAAALAFVQSRIDRLIAEVTEAERKRINQIISREFLGGRRVVRRDVRDKIAATVGLLAREERLVQRAVEEAIAAGSTRLAAERIRRRVAGRLLRERGRRIARSETVMVQNESKIQAWDRAKQDGQIPEGTLKTWIAATNSERTCKICGAPPSAPDGLDRQQVPVGEQFFSAVTGLSYDRPPAHPN